MSDKRLSRPEIHHIARQVRDDEAEPADVVRLLEAFCDASDRGEPPPSELMTYIRDSIREYLDDGRPSLDRAFGITRKRGRPPVDEDTQADMAAEVLRLRMQGNSHQNALSEVGAMFGKSDSVVGAAWKAQRFNALLAVRFERVVERYPWTKDEVERLCKIFKNEKWFKAPKKSGN